MRISHFTMKVQHFVVLELTLYCESQGTEVAAAAEDAATDVLEAMQDTGVEQDEQQGVDDVGPQVDGTSQGVAQVITLDAAPMEDEAPMDDAEGGAFLEPEAGSTETLFLEEDVMETETLQDVAEVGSQTSPLRSVLRETTPRPILFRSGKGRHVLEAGTAGV
jgi:hypothetical protein